MSIDPTLLTLFQELMASYDSTIDTAAGSAFYTEVMTPFLTRIGGSPLDVDLESFMVERLEEEIEDIDVSEHAGVRDLDIRANVVMQEPVVREINAVKIAQSFQNTDQMTRDEVDALMANYFLSLRDGDRAGGSVRMYFSSDLGAANLADVNAVQSGRQPFLLRCHCRGRECR
jgi:hypothetical protein